MRRVICFFLTVALLLIGIPGIGGVGLFSAHAAGSRIVQIAAGEYHSLALFSDGSLYAWGNNEDGRLGDGTTTSRNAPTLIGTGYTAIAAGYNHSLALKGSALYAWGHNEDGRLGDGTTTSRNAPTLIGTGYTAIAAGYNHSVALKVSALYAWGNNDSGQLGDGTTVERHTPILISTGYTALAAGGYYSLALKGGALYAWGNNEDGRLGDGTTTSRNAPTLIGTGYTAIAAGYSHSVALKGSALYTWGWNYSGQLGDGTTVERHTPILISTGYTAIATGDYHSVALKGGALYAWGYNEVGQLGDGTTVERHTPILISTGNTAIATGGYHSLALKGSALYAWGHNGEGQLGDGTTTYRNTTPTRVEFPTPPTLDPLYISRFSVKNANLSVGDKTVFTVETGKSVNLVRLMKDGIQAASTKSFKNQGSKRIWTFSTVMAAPGEFRYWAVASNAGGDGVESADVLVNVSGSSLEVKGFTISSPVLDVGETVTFQVITDKLASKVSILHVVDVTDVYAYSSKPTKTTSTQKIWTIQRKLTEGDRGSIWLFAQIDSSYGKGPVSAILELKVTDNLPRIISISPVNATARRGSELIFEVVTNAAATCVRISNDKNEKWQQTTIAGTPAPNRLTWQVTTTPRQLGSRKFFAQAYRGALPGLKVYLRKILVIK